MRYSDLDCLGVRLRRFPWSRFSLDELRLRLDIVDRHYDPDRIHAIVILLDLLREQPAAEPLVHEDETRRE